MPVHTRQFTIETRGSNEMHDITDEVEAAIEQSRFTSGLATTFVLHTTAAIMIGEYEPGLMADIQIPADQIAPADASYRHNDLNADDNAHSHLIGSIMGPSETVPFNDHRVMLGMWQRVILLELDTSPRTRRVVIQVIGE